MGGELGSLVAARLESESWVGDLVGLDVDPPRRRLRRAAFHRVEPTDRTRIVDLVTSFDPHVVVHFPSLRGPCSVAITMRWTRCWGSLLRWERGGSS